MPAYLAPCPTCGNETASTAAACPKCGRPDPHGQAAAKRRRTNAAIAIVGIIAASVMLYTNRDAPRPEREQSAQATRAAIAGSTATLGLPSGNAGVLYVSRSTDAYDRFNRVATAGDDRGIQELALAGEVFPVRTGDQVLVISGIDPVEVRMTSGSFEGESGFVGRGLLR